MSINQTIGKQAREEDSGTIFREGVLFEWGEIEIIEKDIELVLQLFSINKSAFTICYNAQPALEKKAKKIPKHIRTKLFFFGLLSNTLSTWTMTRSRKEIDTSLKIPQITKEYDVCLRRSKGAKIQPDELSIPRLMKMCPVGTCKAMSMISTNYYLFVSYN